MSDIETVDVRGITVGLDDLTAAVERFDDGDYEATGDGVVVGDVAVKDDGFTDNDVYVYDLHGVESSRIVSFDEVRATVENAQAPDYPRLRVTSHDTDPYGFEIPLSDPGAFVVESEDSSHGPYKAAWDTDVDVSDLRSEGLASEMTDRAERFDGHAYVTDIEVVEGDDD